MTLLFTENVDATPSKCMPPPYSMDTSDEVRCIYREQKCSFETINI